MDFQKQKAIYLQIANYICEQILRDQWQDKIPSVRELAVQIAVNPNTVARTYAHLEEKGVIRIQRGIGYYTEHQAKKQIIALKKKEFFTEIVPQLVNTLQLLDISVEELPKLIGEMNYEKK